MDRSKQEANKENARMEPLDEDNRGLLSATRPALRDRASNNMALAA
jgi:hypothetical protein